MVDKALVIHKLRPPDEQTPLRILFSACLAGLACGYDGSTYGRHDHLRRILGHPKVRPILFCPEDFSFGTPRAMCDIHGGTGIDVLEGKARVLTEAGDDWTEGMVRASERMLAIARENQVDLAILMDISAACGSTVIYSGNRFGSEKKYQSGMGVCAAQLHRNRIPVISQRDFRSLEILYSKLEPGYLIAPEAIDHHQTDWYRDYFGQE